jgi:hypothetical protein
MFLVCADCIPRRDSLLGLPVKVQPTQGDSIFDLRNANHVSRLIPFAACKCNPIDEHRVAVNRSIGCDTTGLEIIPDSTTRISITTNRIVRRKRPFIARLLKPLIEKTSMSFSGEERQAVYDVIDADNASKKRKLEKFFADFVNENITRRNLPGTTPTTHNIDNTIASVATHCI